jgi:hypothetical protein
VKSFKAAGMALAAIFCHLGSQASAATITYDLIDASATFSGGTDSVTGEFTYNTTTDSLISADIVVSGPVYADTFNVSYGTYPPTNDILTQDASLAYTLSIQFTSPLDSSTDPLQFVNIYSGTDFLTPVAASLSVAGDAAPAVTPLPATFSLMLAGLAGLGWLLYLNQKRGFALTV